jgi:gluconokinase
MAISRKGNLVVNILVLETSSSSAKAMICDESGRVIDMANRPFPKESVSSVSYDAKWAYQYTMETGKSIIKKKKVDGISLVGTWQSLLLCDRYMKPVTPTYLWSYTQASCVTNELKKRDHDLADTVYRKTGCVLHAIYPAYKILYLKSRGLDTQSCLLSDQGSYNFFRMTGKHRVSRSMASGSGLLNTHNGQFDDFMFCLAGVRPDQAGELCDYPDSAPLSADAAAYLEIPCGIPVIPAHPDGACNQVGEGALRPKVMTFSVGTSAAMRLSVDHPVLSDRKSLWCYRSPEGWLSGAVASGACNCLEWFKTQYTRNRISFSEMESLPVDPGAIPVFLPFLYGESCPGWRDQRKAGFHDLSPGTGLAEMYNAVLEGVLFHLLLCYRELVRANGEPETFKVSGGILKSTAWTRMLCDIFRREIILAEFEQASLLGGAVLALKALGALSDLRAFAPKDKTVLHPDLSAAKTYEKRFERYLALYNKTDEWEE